MPVFTVAAVSCLIATVVIIVAAAHAVHPELELVAVEAGLSIRSMASVRHTIRNQ